MSNVSQMFPNPNSELAFGLAYVLMVTGFAGKHIYHILCGTVSYMIFLIGAFSGSTIKGVFFHKDSVDRTVSMFTNSFFMYRSVSYCRSRGTGGQFCLH